MTNAEMFIPNLPLIMMELYLKGSPCLYLLKWGQVTPNLGEGV